MQWKLSVEVYEHEGWYIGHCPPFDIKSQGETEQEAYDDFLEALRLFFDCASHSEIMSYLSRIEPCPEPEAWLKPTFSLKSEGTSEEKITGEISLAYA